MKFMTLAQCLFGTAFVATCAAAEPKAPAAAAAEVRHVDAAAADKLIREQKVVILDLRTPEEFKAGHLAGATNLNFSAADFSQQLSRLDKDRTYLIHCASGGRSSAALPTFKKLKFKSIVHLDGGLLAWQKAGKPVEK